MLDKAASQYSPFEPDNRVDGPASDERERLSDDPSTGSKRKRRGSGDLISPEDVRVALGDLANPQNNDRNGLMPPSDSSVERLRRRRSSFGEASLRVCYS